MTEESKQIGEIEVDPPQVKHNWLYSMVPAHTDSVHKLIGAYLTGYCKNCDQYFTKRMRVDYDESWNDNPVVRRAWVPKWGCTPPDL